MHLAAVSENYGHFYVPAFAVRVDGLDLLQEYTVAITQAEVDLTLGGAGRFSFTVANAFDPKIRDFRTGDAAGQDLLDVLAFGAPIEIAMGYGDRGSLKPPLIQGVVTQITTDFPESGTPELVVSGYDHAFPMMGGKISDNWSNQRDSEVVGQIARRNNLEADVVRTEVELDQTNQNQESDLEFVNKLAERNGYETYVTGKTLRFGPPQNTGSGIVTLEWGKGLLSFKPDGNLVGQISGVEVYGWNPKTKDKIVGKASHGEESGRDQQRDSAGDRLARLLRDQPVLRVRQPVFTQAEATQRARAILKQRSEEFLTGEGETIGLPELRPDRNVTLQGLGRKFSKTYYVREITHRFDGNGYRTRFKIKESTL